MTVGGKREKTEERSASPRIEFLLDRKSTLISTQDPRGAQKRRENSPDRVFISKLGGSERGTRRKANATELPFSSSSEPDLLSLQLPSQLEEANASNEKTKNNEIEDLGRRPSRKESRGRRASSVALIRRASCGQGSRKRARSS